MRVNAVSTALKLTCLPVPRRATIQRGGSILFRLEKASLLSVSFCVIGLDISHLFGRAEVTTVWNLHPVCDEYLNIFAYSNIYLRICDIQIQILSLMVTNIFIYSKFGWRIFEYQTSQT